MLSGQAIPIVKMVMLSLGVLRTMYAVGIAWPDNVHGGSSWILFVAASSSSFSFQLVTEAPSLLTGSTSLPGCCCCLLTHGCLPFSSIVDKIRPIIATKK